MNVIQNINTTTFSLNGIRYLKNYVSRVSGSRVEVFNVYDRKETLIPLTHFNNFTVNGVMYESAKALQIALLYQLYYRNNLVPGGDPTDYAALESQMAALQDDVEQMDDYIDMLNGTNNNIAIWDYRAYLLDSDSDIATATVADWMNALTVPYEVRADRSPIFFEFRRAVVGGDLRYIFLFVKGKGKWGGLGAAQPGSRVYAYDLKRFPVVPVTVTDIDDDETIIVPLGEIAPGTFLTAVNAEEHDLSNVAFRYYFSYYTDDVLYLALFKGTPGTYGGGALGTNDFMSSDFAQVTNSTVTTNPTLEVVTQAGNMTGYPFGVHTEGAQLLFQPDGLLFTGANGKNAKLRMNDVEANAQFNFPEDKAGAHTVAMLSDIFLGIGKIVKTGKGYVINSAGSIVTNSGPLALHEKGDLFRGISPQGKYIPYMRYKGTGNVNSFNNHCYEIEISAILPDEPGYILPEG